MIAKTLARRWGGRLTGASKPTVIKSSSASPITASGKKALLDKRTAHLSQPRLLRSWPGECLDPAGGNEDRHFWLGLRGYCDGRGSSFRGHHVCGVDVDAVKVDQIRSGQSPVVEPGIDELLATAVQRSTRFSFYMQMDLGGPAYNSVGWAKARAHGRSRVGKIVRAPCPRGEGMPDDFAHPTGYVMPRRYPYCSAPACRRGRRSPGRRRRGCRCCRS